MLGLGRVDSCTNGRLRCNTSSGGWLEYSSGRGTFLATFLVVLLDQSGGKKEDFGSISCRFSEISSCNSQPNLSRVSCG